MNDPGMQFYARVGRIEREQSRFPRQIVRGLASVAFFGAAAYLRQAGTDAWLLIVAYFLCGIAYLIASISDSMRRKALDEARREYLMAVYPLGSDDEK
jgi:hypothetical protein